MKVYSHWGYVEVGINNTEILLRNDTIFDDIKSEDEEFHEILNKC